MTLSSETKTDFVLTSEKRIEPYLDVAASSSSSIEPLRHQLMCSNASCPGYSHCIFWAAHERAARCVVKICIVRHEYWTRNTDAVRSTVDHSIGGEFPIKDPAYEKPQCATGWVMSMGSHIQGCLIIPVSD